MATQQLTRTSYPILTDTTLISALDKDNPYRPRLWKDMEGAINFLNAEDNGLLLTLIERFGAESIVNTIDNPFVWWTEATRLDIHSKLTTAISNTATSVVIDDQRVAPINTWLYWPKDGEITKVTANDYSAAMTVTRGYRGTTRTAKSVGDICIALPRHMAELTEPTVGTGQLPNEPVWNSISTVYEAQSVSRMQQNSNIRGGWGQREKMAMETMLKLRRSVGKALMFSERGADTVTGEGREYSTKGIFHYIKDRMLDLGEFNGNLTWPILNDFLEESFTHDASSQTKIMIAGLWLWKAIMRIYNDLGRQTNEVTGAFVPELGTRAFRINTDAGFEVQLMLDKFGLGVNEGLGDWGFILDMKNISGARYQGLEFQWVQNVQGTRQINLIEDVFIGSYSVMVLHSPTHAVIRGANRPIIWRDEDF